MGMDLGVKTFRHEPEYFEAGPHPVAKSVKTAAADIPAHAPVVLNNDGKLELVTVTKGGTEEKPTYSVNAAGLYGVAPEAIANGEEGVVYLTGDFFADSLTLPENAQPAALEVALRNIGIFLK